MRWSSFPYSEIPVEDLLKEIGYNKVRQDMDEEHFRSRNFHLIIRKRKTRIDYHLHKDMKNIYRNHKAIKSGKNLEEEKKYITKHLNRYNVKGF